ncbi:MAG: hypothetical protein MR219_08405, partial [Clostridiales bacterium]|nr:hypothetical protein [Clostridiales bacterium]
RGSPDHVAAGHSDQGSHVPVPRPQPHHPVITFIMTGGCQMDILAAVFRVGKAAIHPKAEKISLTRNKTAMCIVLLLNQ